MSCNCGGNDYNISIGNNGNCEPSTPEYYISLGGVGVNGYSPVVNFVNQTEQSFSIEVDNINGIDVSDPVPKLSYVSDQINNINTNLENKLNINFSNSPSTISFPNKTQNIKANRLRLYTGDYYYSGMLLQLGQTSGQLGYYSGKHLFLEQDKIHYSTSITSDDNEIATIGDIPTKTSDLTNDSGFITNSDIPTVGNGTITITQGGVTKGTFTTNQSGNATIELDEGGGVTNPLTITDEVSNNFLQFVVNDSGSYIRTGTQGLTLNGYLINTVDNPLSLDDVAFGLKAIGLKYDNDTIKVNQDGQLYADVQGGGGSYTAGTGIDITNDTISVDNTVAMKTDIPTVNDSTVTFTQGGVTKGTITLNQSGNATIELDEGGDVNNKLEIDGSNADANISINGNTLTSSGIYRGIGNVTIGNKTTLGADSTSGYLRLPSFNLTAYDSGSSLNTSEPFYINRTNDTKVYYHGTLASDEIATIGQLPSVYNPTITFTQGGVTKGSITLNQTSDQTIALDAGGSGGGTVDSVNGQTGDVVLNASDVGALPDTTVIPTKTSDLTNDSNFATVSQIPTNNNQLTNGAGYITASALNSYAKTADLATVATSGSYNDLSNKPTIPTVNNATLTIQKNGTTVKTFTANASSNVTCNITVPTKTSDLTNDSSFITATALADYQPLLVSGTNIKTINSTSLLGSGNINTLVNTATKSTSLSIGDNASTLSYTTNVGIGSQATATAGQAFGHYAIASGQYSLALGQGAEVSSNYAIQLGKGTNATATTLSVGFGNSGNYQLLNGTTGLIPDARISSNIARSSNVADKDLSNLSTTGQAIIDSKVNTSDIWYDDTSSTLYIGVAQ